MRGRVLIADDEGINRLFVKTVLLNNGWDVKEALNGQEAVEIAAREVFDIILMDIKMPVMDGREAVRRIRKIPGYHTPGTRIPILGLTAYSDEVVGQETRRDGMDGLITKPVTEEQLLSQIDSFLSKLRK